MTAGQGLGIGEPELELRQPAAGNFTGAEAGELEPGRGEGQSGGGGQRLMLLVLSATQRGYRIEAPRG